MVSVGETKMREFIRNGKLPTLLLDGKYLLLESDLEAFLQRHYGPLKPVAVERSRLPPLPRDVANSDLLKKQN